RPAVRAEPGARHHPGAGHPRRAPGPSLPPADPPGSRAPGRQRGTLMFDRLLGLAWRQLLRDARAGELRVLFFALLVAVAASTAIGYFGARLNGAMLLRATEFLGADLVLNGSSPAAAEQLEAGRALGL